MPLFLQPGLAEQAVLEWGSLGESSAGRNRTVWGHWPPPSPWELPCPQADASAAARPAFRHPAVPWSWASAERGCQAKHGLWERCSGSSLLSPSCTNTFGLTAGSAPLGTRHPPGPSAGENRDPTGPCCV